MYRDNFITSLRTELLTIVESSLTPVALKYGYSETALESNIKWRPQVLVLGNYSSGKSTLINELLGADIQATGQAPTDDSFTVITFDGAVDTGPIRVTEQRDGKYLLNDPQYPFEMLKRHGQRFSAHFRLKKVNSPFLRNLAVIDTPGMLDSITERDRGYDYQDVIGDLAQIADLVLVLFDPHKAGTVREAHASLRDTLPAKTFEDRVLFVLNRIDECASLNDLLRVYGTLCWNLSQMTGRKDIPMIHLTYSPRAVNGGSGSPLPGYLQFLENQREELKKAIQLAPRHRLDNLTAFVETHSERLSHMLEALVSYRRHQRRWAVTYHLCGVALGLLVGAGAGLGWKISPLGAGMPLPIIGAMSGVVAVLFYTFWASGLGKPMRRRRHRRQLAAIDDLTPLTNQTRRDSWQSVRDLVRAFLEKSRGRFSLGQAIYEYNCIKKVYREGTREIREALNELAALPEDAPPEAYARLIATTAEAPGTKSGES